METESKKDFFVSYNCHDQKIAEWIAEILEAAGYTTAIQAWDFRPGRNFVLDMHAASRNTNRTIAVLSPNYLRSEFTQPEWAAAFVQDPTGMRRTLIPVRVEACELTGLLAAIGYVNLVGLTEVEMRQTLLAGVSQEPVERRCGSVFPRLAVPQNLPRVNPVFVGREKAFELSWQELNQEARRLAMLLSMFALAEIAWVLDDNTTGE